MQLEMSARVIFDSPEKSSDLFYATRFYAPDPILYIETKKSKFLFVSPLEFDRAKKECAKDIKIIETYNKEVSELIYSFCKENSINQISVPYFFPSGLHFELQKWGLKVIIGEKPFFPERKRKTKHEIAKIAEALKITEKAMQRAEQVINEAKVMKNNILKWNGEILSSEIMKKIINLELCKYDAIARETIVSCGKGSSEPHNTGSGAIKACQPIIIDIFPQASSGYWGDITRTFIKWKADSKFMKIFNTVRIAGLKAIENIKSGVKASDIYQIAFDYIKSQGFKTGKMNGKNCGFFHSLGHGVGLDIHESPVISPKNTLPLEVGNVITIEPGLYYPDFGGVRIEDLIVVRNNGFQNLTEFHKEPIIT